MLACDVFFDTDSTIEKMVDLLEPLLRQWVGDDYRKYYIPSQYSFSYWPGKGRFLISIERNMEYNETDEDEGLFRYKLTYIDMDEQYSDAENLARIIAMLELLWAHGIPTLTRGFADELPYGGGEEGPVAWPAH